MNSADLKTLNTDPDLASHTTKTRTARGGTPLLRRIATCIVMAVVAVGCGRKQPQGLFDFNAPVELVSREYVPSHFETRSVCEPGWTTVADNMSKFDRCASRRQDSVLVAAKWFVIVSQCRGWTESPPSSECGDRGTSKIEVAGEVRYAEAAGLIGQRVRSPYDWAPVQQ